MAMLIENHDKVRQQKATEALTALFGRNAALHGLVVESVKQAYPLSSDLAAEIEKAVGQKDAGKLFVRLPQSGQAMFYPAVRDVAEKIVALKPRGT
jgi:hypothetical protein